MSDSTICWDAKRVEEALSDVRMSRPAVQKRLAALLNLYHNRSFSNNYLGIWAGDWIEHYLHHVAIAIAVAQFGLVSKEVGITHIAADPAEYMRRAVSDAEFHSQLAAAVRWIICGNPSSDIRLAPVSIFIHCGRRESIGRKALRYLTAKANGVLFTDLYLKCSNVDALKTAFSWRHWARWDELSYQINSSAVIDHSWRRSQALCGGNDLTAIAVALMPFYLPVVFLEGYQDFREKALGLKLRRPQAVYSANALHDHLLFKLLVAEWQLEGTKLLYHQHGGNYGLDAYHALEDYELSVADRYYTWGWGDNSCRQQPLSPAFPQFQRRQRKWMLVICGGYPALPYRLHYQPMPGTFETVRRDLIQFLKGVNSLPDILVRPYHQDYGWGMRELIHNAAPRAKIDDLDIDQFRRFGQSRLVVHTSLSTSWLETLALNLPTVCFFDPKIYRFRDEAMALIALMEGVGILHRSGADAALFIANLGFDPEGWWFRSEVQEARSKFIEKYANFSSNWKMQWEIEFKSAIDQVGSITS